MPDDIVDELTRRAMMEIAGRLSADPTIISEIAEKRADELRTKLAFKTFEELKRRGKIDNNLLHLLTTGSYEENQSWIRKVIPEYDDFVLKALDEATQEMSAASSPASSKVLSVEFGPRTPSSFWRKLMCEIGELIDDTRLLSPAWRVLTWPFSRHCPRCGRRIRNIAAVHTIRFEEADIVSGRIQLGLECTRCSKLYHLSCACDTGTTERMSQTCKCGSKDFIRVPTNFRY